MPIDSNLQYQTARRLGKSKEGVRERGTRHERSSYPKSTTPGAVCVRAAKIPTQNPPVLADLAHRITRISHQQGRLYEQYTRSVPPVLESQDPQVD